MQPCVHGEVCREYFRRFGKIIQKKCPRECKYYSPKYQDSKKTYLVKVEVNER